MHRCLVISHFEDPSMFESSPFASRGIAMGSPPSVGKTSSVATYFYIGWGNSAGLGLTGTHWSWWTLVDIGFSVILGRN